MGGTGTSVSVTHSQHVMGKSGTQDPDEYCTLLPGVRPVSWGIRGVDTTSSTPPHPGVGRERLHARPGARNNRIPTPIGACTVTLYATFPGLDKLTSEQLPLVLRVVPLSPSLLDKSSLPFKAQLKFTSISLEHENVGVLRKAVVRTETLTPRTGRHRTFSFIPPRVPCAWLRVDTQ